MQQPLIAWSVASYRDSQLLPTLQSGLYQAHFPSRLLPVVCWQGDLRLPCCACAFNSCCSVSRDLSRPQQQPHPVAFKARCYPLSAAPSCQVLHSAEARNDEDDRSTTDGVTARQLPLYANRSFVAAPSWATAAACAADCSSADAAASIVAACVPSAAAAGPARSAVLAAAPRGKPPPIDSSDSTHVHAHRTRKRCSSNSRNSDRCASPSCSFADAEREACRKNKRKYIACFHCGAKIAHELHAAAKSIDSGCTCWCHSCEATSSCGDAAVVTAQQLPSVCVGDCRASAKRKMKIKGAEERVRSDGTRSSSLVAASARTTESAALLLQWPCVGDWEGAARESVPCGRTSGAAAFGKKGTGNEAAAVREKRARGAPRRAAGRLLAAADMCGGGAAAAGKATPACPAAGTGAQAETDEAVLQGTKVSRTQRSSQKKIQGRAEGVRKDNNTREETFEAPPAACTGQKHPTRPVKASAYERNTHFYEEEKMPGRIHGQRVKGELFQGNKDEAVMLSAAREGERSAAGEREGTAEKLCASACEGKEAADQEDEVGRMGFINREAFSLLQLFTTCWAKERPQQQQERGGRCSNDECNNRGNAFRSRSGGRTCREKRCCVARKRRRRRRRRRKQEQSCLPAERRPMGCCSDRFGSRSGRMVYASRGSQPERSSSGQLESGSRSGQPEDGSSSSQRGSSSSNGGSQPGSGNSCRQPGSGRSCSQPGSSSSNSQTESSSTSQFESGSRSSTRKSSSGCGHASVSTTRAFTRSIGRSIDIHNPTKESESKSEGRTTSLSADTAKVEDVCFFVTTPSSCTTEASPNTVSEPELCPLSSVSSSAAGRLCNAPPCCTSLVFTSGASREESSVLPPPVSHSISLNGRSSPAKSYASSLAKAYLSPPCPPSCFPSSFVTASAPGRWAIAASPFSSDSRLPGVIDSASCGAGAIPSSAAAPSGVAFLQEQPLEKIQHLLPRWVRQQLLVATCEAAAKGGAVCCRRGGFPGCCRCPATVLSAAPPRVVARFHLLSLPQANVLDSKSAVDHVREKEDEEEEEEQLQGIKYEESIMAPFGIPEKTCASPPQQLPGLDRPCDRSSRGDQSRGSCRTTSRSSSSSSNRRPSCSESGSLPSRKDGSRKCSSSCTCSCRCTRKFRNKKRVTPRLRPCMSDVGRCGGCKYTRWRNPPSGAGSCSTSNTSSSSCGSASSSGIAELRSQSLCHHSSTQACAAGRQHKRSEPLSSEGNANVCLRSNGSTVSSSRDSSGGGRCSSGSMCSSGCSRRSEGSNSSASEGRQRRRDGVGPQGTLQVAVMDLEGPCAAEDTRRTRRKWWIVAEKLRIRFIFLDWRRSTGPCLARYLCEQVLPANKEEELLLLQTDSHMRFAPHFDCFLVRQLFLAAAEASNHQPGTRTAVGVKTLAGAAAALPARALQQAHRAAGGTTSKTAAEAAVAVTLALPAKQETGGGRKDVNEEKETEGISGRMTAVIYETPQTARRKLVGTDGRRTVYETDERNAREERGRQAAAAAEAEKKKDVPAAEQEVGAAAKGERMDATDEKGAEAGKAERGLAAEEKEGTPVGVEEGVVTGKAEDISDCSTHRERCVLNSGGKSTSKVVTCEPCASLVCCCAACGSRCDCRCASCSCCCVAPWKRILCSAREDFTSRMQLTATQRKRRILTSRHKRLLQLHNRKQRSLARRGKPLLVCTVFKRAVRFFCKGERRQQQIKTWHQAAAAALPRQLGDASAALQQRMRVLPQKQEFPRVLLTAYPPAYDECMRFDEWPDSIGGTAAHHNLSCIVAAAGTGGWTAPTRPPQRGVAKVVSIASFSGAYQIDGKNGPLAPSPAGAAAAHFSAACIGQSEAPDLKISVSYKATGEAPPTSVSPPLSSLHPASDHSRRELNPGSAHSPAHSHVLLPPVLLCAAAFDKKNILRIAGRPLRAPQPAGRESYLPPHRPEQPELPRELHREWRRVVENRPLGDQRHLDKKNRQGDEGPQRRRQQQQFSQTLAQEQRPHRREAESWQERHMQKQTMEAPESSANARSALAEHVLGNLAEAAASGTLNMGVDGEDGTGAARKSGSGCGWSLRSAFPYPDSQLEDGDPSLAQRKRGCCCCHDKQAPLKQRQEKCVGPEGDSGSFQSVRRSLFWAAGFSFGPARVVKEVGYDCKLPFIFFGEEITMAMRLFTHGWQFFSPGASVVFHLWSRQYRPFFRQDLRQLYNSNHKCGSSRTCSTITGSSSHTGHNVFSSTTCKIRETCCSPQRRPSRWQVTSWESRGRARSCVPCQMQPQPHSNNGVSGISDIQRSAFPCTQSQRRHSSGGQACAILSQNSGASRSSHDASAGSVTMPLLRQVDNRNANPSSATSVRSASACGEGENEKGAWGSLSKALRCCCMKDSSSSSSAKAEENTRDFREMRGTRLGGESSVSRRAPCAPPVLIVNSMMHCRGQKNERKILEISPASGPTTPAFVNRLFVGDTRKGVTHLEKTDRPPSTAAVSGTYRGKQVFVCTAAAANHESRSCIERATERCREPVTLARASAAAGVPGPAALKHTNERGKKKHLAAAEDAGSSRMESKNINTADQQNDKHKNTHGLSSLESLCVRKGNLRIRQGNAFLLCPTGETVTEGYGAIDAGDVIEKDSSSIDIAKERSDAAHVQPATSVEYETAGDARTKQSRDSAVKEELSSFSKGKEEQKRTPFEIVSADREKPSHVSRFPLTTCCSLRDAHAAAERRVQQIFAADNVLLSRRELQQLGFGSKRAPQDFWKAVGVDWHSRNISLYALRGGMLDDKAFEGAGPTATAALDIALNLLREQLTQPGEHKKETGMSAWN